MKWAYEIVIQILILLKEFFFKKMKETHDKFIKFEHRENGAGIYTWSILWVKSVIIHHLKHFILHRYL